MPPRKGTKAYNEEYVYAYYGIHMDTFEIGSVYQKRDGTLSGPHGSHYVARGQRAESEIMLVYHLTDVRMLPIHMVESHSTKIIEELKVVAATKRAERDSRA